MRYVLPDFMKIPLANGFTASYGEWIANKIPGRLPGTNVSFSGTKNVSLSSRVLSEIEEYIRDIIFIWFLKCNVKG